MPWGEFHDYVLLGVDSLLVSMLYAVYRKRDKIIQNIIEAPSVGVGTDLETLLQGQNELRSSESVIPYVAIRGRVKELGQTIESSSGLKGIMQVVTLNEHSFRRHAFNHWWVWLCRDVDNNNLSLRYAAKLAFCLYKDLRGLDSVQYNSRRGDNVRTIHQAFNSVPFGLTTLRESDSKILVDVENPFDANVENLLLTVSTNFTPSNTSVASTVMGFFTGVAVRGIEKTEEFLPVDTIVTGIGRLVRDSNGRIKLVEPRGDDLRPFILSTLPVESIVKKMESRNTMYKLATFVLFSLGMVVAARRIHAWWKMRQLAKMREKILRQRSEIDLMGLTERETCTACLVNPREVILLNCGHVCVCADCCVKLGGKCPICRETIVSTHAAYIA